MTHGPQPEPDEGYADLASWPLATLLERIAVGGPAPASGSAAATAAGLAAALAAKVARRSARMIDDAAALARVCDDFRERAVALAGADAAAVQAMVTDPDGVPDAARQVPTQIRDLCSEIAQLAAYLAAHGKPALHADAVGAAQLAQAGRAATEAILASNEPTGS